MEEMTIAELTARINGAQAPTLPAPPVVSGHKLTGEPGPLFAALAKAQAAFGDIKRTRTVKVTPRDSAPYTFNYAPLDEVLRAVSVALNAAGVVVLQPLYEDADGWHLKTVLGHSSGATIECSASIPWPERKWWDKNAGEYKASKGTWQDFGSAVTYARRYMVGSLLGVAPEEDDDGNAASGNERESSDRTGPRANTQPTPPVAPKQAKPAPERPAAAPKPAPAPEQAPKPVSVPPPAKDPVVDALVASGAVHRTNQEPPADLAEALAQEEISPRLQPVSDTQNEAAAALFRGKVWPRINPDTTVVEPTLLDNIDVRRQWLREVMGISNPKEQLTSFAQMAKVLERLEKLPNKAV